MIQPEKNISIAPYTSYKIGGKAREVYFPGDTSEMLEVFQSLRNLDTDYYILGGGSNVLVGEGFWDGVVVITTHMDSFETHEDYLLCSAGIPSSQVAEIAHDHAKTGLEFLYLLQGSIGGALAGNARFDNKNVSDILISVLAVHPKKGMKRFRAQDIIFDYKDTRIIKEGWIISELSLAWKDGDIGVIEKYMEEIKLFRANSHHFDFPSCGCVFKNDHSRNIQAGRLIDTLGLKGLSVGGAQVAPFHANFIIDTGSATACDILDLIELIEKTVLEKTGITLEREVKVLGSFK